MTARLPLLAARVLAYGLDVAVLFAVLAPLGWLVQRALGVEPRTGPEIWRVLLVGFSLPTWLYFTVADAAGGRTLGKRWLGLRALTGEGRGIAPARALLRTAVKLLPWELTHASAFALARAEGGFTPAQWAGVLAANVLALGYLALAAATGGRRSVHDFAAGTEVRRA